MREHSDQEKTLVGFFGKDHVLEHNYFHSKIPLDKELISQIMGEYLSGPTLEEKYEIEMIMKTQKIAEELKDSDAYQTEDYTSGLIKESDFRNSKDIEEGYNKIENLVNKKFIEPMLERIKNNKFDKSIEEITKNIILYTQKTGKMIDIFGPNNITLFINKEGIT